MDNEPLSYCTKFELSSTSSVDLDQSKIVFSGYLKLIIIPAEVYVREFTVCVFQPILKPQILDSSKLKEFADDNFKFGENSRKFSKQVENTVEKGEISLYNQFLLFPKLFQKTCTADM